MYDYKLKNKSIKQVLSGQKDLIITIHIHLKEHVVYSQVN